MTRTVLLPGSDRVFTLVMAKDSSALTQTLKKTRISLFLGLGFAATGLVLGFMFQILYGLRPAAPAAPRAEPRPSGSSGGFRLRYPWRSSRWWRISTACCTTHGELLQRARSHTGNLAHALKTPLSIMRNQVTQLPPEDQAALGEQLDQIQRHIDYHLGKARVTGAAKILGCRPRCGPGGVHLPRLLPPLSRQDGGLAGAGQSGGRGGGAGLRRDGGQPAGERLQVVRQRAAHLQRRAGGWITLRIEDDGPGMSEDQIAKAVLRGAPRREGAGFRLGLNIVSDLAEAYRGSLIMGRAELGARRFPPPAQGGQGRVTGAPSGPLPPPCWQGAAPGIRYVSCFRCRKGSND